MQAAADAYEVAARQKRDNITDHKRAVLTNEEKEQLVVLMRETRALLHGTAVSFGVAPYNLQNILAPDSTVAKAQAVLIKLHVKGIGARETAASDLPTAYDLVVKEVTALVKGAQGCLITDAGSVKRLQKGVCILFKSHSIRGPGFVLIDMALPESVDDDGDVVVYDHDKCAEDVVASCKLINLDIKTQVRCRTAPSPRADMRQHARQHAGVSVRNPLFAVRRSRT